MCRDELRNPDFQRTWLPKGLVDFMLFKHTFLFLQMCNHLHSPFSKNVFFVDDTIKGVLINLLCNVHFPKKQQNVPLIIMYKYFAIHCVCF